MMDIRSVIAWGEKWGPVLSKMYEGTLLGGGINPCILIGIAVTQQTHWKTLHLFILIIIQ